MFEAFKGPERWLFYAHLPLPSIWTWTDGISATTSVPSPGLLWTSRWPPSSAILSRMLERPRRSPGPPPSVISSGLKPGPQSRTCRRTESFRRRSVILTRAEGACLWTLVRASCTTRKSAVSTSDGRRQTLVSQSFLVVDLGAFATDLLDLQADGGAKPEIVERGGPQICYDIPGLTDR